MASSNRLFDISHTVMIMASSWIWLIANFGNADTDYIPPYVLMYDDNSALILEVIHLARLLYDQCSVVTFGLTEIYDRCLLSPRPSLRPLYMGFLSAGYINVGSCYIRRELCAF